MIACAVFLATAVGRIHLIFPVLALFQPVMLSGVAAIGFVVISKDPRRNVRNSWSRPLTWLVWFLGWSILTIPGSLWPGGSFTAVFDDLAKTVVFAIMMVAAVRTVRDAERLALVYFISAAIYSLIVYLDKAGGGGRFDGLYTYDANDFAVFAVTAIPLGLYFFMRAGGFKKLLTLGGLAFLLLSFLGAQSRGGFLALICVAITLLIYLRSVRASVRLGVTVLGTTLFMALAGPQYIERIKTIWKGEEDYNRTSETGRIEVWKRGLGYTMQNPLLGVGLGQYGTAEGTLSQLALRQQYGQGVKWSTAHNTYIQTSAETGIPGACFFVLFLMSTMVMLRRASRLPDKAYESGVPLAQVMLASLVGFAVGAVFLSMAHLSMGYLLTGIGLGTLKIVPRQRSAPVRAPARTPVRRGAARMR